MVGVCGDVTIVDGNGWDGVYIGTQEVHLSGVECHIEHGCSLNCRQNSGMITRM